jgi:serine/threonine protein kinase
MSSESKFIISRLLEVDPKRRFKASDLIREPWIKCNDLPLSIFESAGILFRANSMDGRAIMSMTSSDEKTHHIQSNSSKAECFNNGVANLHMKAIEHLK